MSISKLRAPARTMTAISALLLCAANVSGVRAATPADSAASSGPGVQGEIRVNDLCPVGQICQDAIQPLFVNAVTFTLADGTPAGRAFTNSRGRYAITLPPGRYRVQPEVDTAVQCPEVWATVSGTRFRPANMVCVISGHVLDPS